MNEETIKSRAPKTFNLLPKAFAFADSAYVIDNSNEAIPILLKEGNAVIKSSTFPKIIKSAIQKILKKLPDIYTIKTES